ncbi:hypothetical protein [Phytopseudomonas daroniae]|uniref:hypothetical protein n=1 Tax=Pseudomonadaceae TaxID=135621 RepID=UPI001037BA2C|nr:MULTISPECIES: hypothetical protein [Pseudomonas]
MSTLEWAITIAAAHQCRDNGHVSARVVDVPETGYGNHVAQADVGWMTLFSSTIAIAERWTDRAA